MKTKTIKVVLVFSFVGVMLVSFSPSKQITSKYEGLQTKVAGIQSGKLSAQKLLEAGKLEATDKAYEITLFVMAAALPKATGGAEIIYPELASASGKFTEEMKTAIKTFKPGTKVWFEHVEAYRKGDKLSEKIPGVTITIGE